MNIAIPALAGEHKRRRLYWSGGAPGDPGKAVDTFLRILLDCSWSICKIQSVCMSTNPTKIMLFDSSYPALSISLSFAYIDIMCAMRCCYQEKIANPENRVYRLGG